MQPSIRPAEPDDVPSLAVVRQQAIEAGFEGVYDRASFAPLVASRAAALSEWVGAAEVLTLVVETDVTPVAFGVYDDPDIEALYTAPHYQGEGCATALLERFEDRARANEQVAMTITAPRNAVPFFEGHGFERRGTVDREGLTFHQMEKPLG